MNKINQLRNILKKNNCDGYLIPKNDEYFGEYVPHNKDRLKFISGFSGSYGLAIILQNKSYLFVDGRYTLQAKAEVNKSFKICEISKIKPQDIFKKLNRKISIGFDPKLFTSSALNNISKNNKISLVPIKDNLINKIWKNKSRIKNKKFYLLKERFHGEHYLNKILKLKKILKLNKINYLLCTEIENISWLLNIRGYDSLYSPLTNGKLIIRADGKITFFTNLNKINPKIKRFFKKNVTFIKENFFLNYLKQIKKSKILIDKRTCSFDCEKIISSSNKIIRTKLQRY